MTLNQLITLNDVSPFRELTVDDGIAFSKELLGEHSPYSIRKDIEGADIILFNTHFINCMRQALTDGCVARMGKLELEFWYEFVAYQQDIQDGVLDTPIIDLQRLAALEELSRWISDEIAGIPHQEVKPCYIPYVEEV